VKRPNPATAIALIALFFSLGGVSLAAARYVITSTAQIKPSVLKELRGKRGPAGPAGPAGVDGVPGAKGSMGAQGIQGDQGPQGVAGTPAAQPPFAEVDANGQFTANGVTNVTHVASSGIYCITLAADSDTASHYASVTLTADSDVGAFAAIDFTAPDCPAGETEVFTGIAVVGASNTEGSTFDGEASDEPFVIVYP
jgi:Collagen triple helix repeat (20 copies)